MGLIKAAIGSVSGVISDQFKEYIYCDSLTSDILVAKGQKRDTKRGGNNGSDNIITNGSVIAINEGQCMMIVENGKVGEVSAEPGEYTYDNTSEPSIFVGEMGQAFKDSFEKIKQRFALGGETGNDQRVYYFNTKEIVGNKYGTANPVPFRVVDNNIGLDIDIAIRCNGEYSYKIVDPMLFYTNVCGNVTAFYDRSEIDSTLKSELLTALQPAFAKLSEQGIRYSSIPAHTMELADALNEVLSVKWTQSRGIKVASFGVNSITASKEDEDMIKQLQKNAIMRDPTMAAANLAGAQADAMRAAASNEGGAMTGFMGMGMAQNVGGVNAQSLFAMGQQSSQQTDKKDSWVCACGSENSGKFCSSCGKGKPAPVGAWKCECGTENTGNFCANCGKAKPVSSEAWKCECGTENTGKFCSNCGKGRA